MHTLSNCGCWKKYFVTKSGEHNITSDVKVISMQSINESYQRMQKSDVKYRFVIDLKTLS
jgi:D-arabinose 1-dehydrogenase-like Zn-dependent alcohol dehydrogenase